MSLPRTHAELQTERERSWLTADPQREPRDIEREMLVEVRVSLPIKKRLSESAEIHDVDVSYEEMANALIDNCFHSETLSPVQRSGLVSGLMSMMDGVPSVERMQ